MSRHLYLDASPPPYLSSRDVLDKSAFKKSLNVLGARVHPANIDTFLKASEIRKYVMEFTALYTS